MKNEYHSAAQASVLLALFKAYGVHCSETHILLYDAIIKALTFTTGMLLVLLVTGNATSTARVMLISCKH